MFSFQKSYFKWAVGLFITEVIIALFVHDSLIRPVGGDFLVVIMLYCFVKSFTDMRDTAIALCVLLLAYLIETCQYYNITDMLGIREIQAARIILGTHFSWLDMAAYTSGILFVMIVERKLKPAFQ